MSLSIYPIQLPTTPEGGAHAPLLLLFDGSGFAFEYANLLPLDRLVYGVSVVVPKFNTFKIDEKAVQLEYEEYLTGEFRTVDDYIDQLVRLIEEEVGHPPLHHDVYIELDAHQVLDVQEDDDDRYSDDEEAAGDDADDNDKAPAPKNRVQHTSALHIGGFSFGGFVVSNRAIYSDRPTDTDATHARPSSSRAASSNTPYAPSAAPRRYTPTCAPSCCSTRTTPPRRRCARSIRRPCAPAAR